MAVLVAGLGCGASGDGPAVPDDIDAVDLLPAGKGLLLGLSGDLSSQTTLTLSEPRDGPLTHTDPAMTFNDGVWGVTRLDPP